MTKQVYPLARWGAVGAAFGLVVGVAVSLAIYESRQRVGVETEISGPVIREMRRSGFPAPLGSETALQRLVVAQIKAKDLAGALETIRLIDEPWGRRRALEAVVVELSSKPGEFSVAALEKLKSLEDDNYVEGDVLVMIGEAQTHIGELEGARKTLIEARSMILEEKRISRSSSAVMQGAVVVDKNVDEGPVPPTGAPMSMWIPEPSKKSTYDFALWPIVLGVLGFMFAALLKPALEGIGKVFIGGSIAGVLESEELRSSLGLKKNRFRRRPRIIGGMPRRIRRHRRR